MRPTIVVATRLTTPVREALLAGRKVLLIANSADALIDPERNLPLGDRHNFPSMLLKRAPERRGTGSGWALSAGGARRAHGLACRTARCSTSIGAGLLPNYVLTGFPSTAFGGLVDAGMAVGWLHLAAAFIKRSFLGKALDHGLDLRPDVDEGAGKPACAASSEGAGRELRQAETPRTSR